MKTGQTKKFKSFYSGLQVIREIINDSNFVIEDVKTKKQEKAHYDRLKLFSSRSATTDKKEPKKAKSEPRISQNDLTEDNDFVEIEVVTPKMNNTGRREVNLEENIVKLTIVLKLTMRQLRTNCLKHQWVGVQDNQKILTQTTKAEAQRYLRLK